MRQILQRLLRTLFFGCLFPLPLIGVVLQLCAEGRFVIAACFLFSLVGYGILYRTKVLYDFLFDKTSNREICDLLFKSTESGKNPEIIPIEVERPVVFQPFMKRVVDPRLWVEQPFDLLSIRVVNPGEIVSSVRDGCPLESEIFSLPERRLREIRSRGRPSIVLVPEGSQELGIVRTNTGQELKIWMFRLEQPITANAKEREKSCTGFLS